jgi:hypothetical protein
MSRFGVVRPVEDRSSEGRFSPSTTKGGCHAWKICSSSLDCDARDDAAGFCQLRDQPFPFLQPWRRRHDARKPVERRYLFPHFAQQPAAGKYLSVRRHRAKSKPWGGRHRRIGIPIPIERGISRIGQLRSQNLHAIVPRTRLLDRDFQRRHQLNAVLDAVAEVLEPASGLRTF